MPTPQARPRGEEGSAVRSRALEYVCPCSAVLKSLISLSFSTPSHPPAGKFRAHAPARFVLAFGLRSLSCRL